MKIEITIKDLIIFFLIIGLIMFVAITYINIKSAIDNTRLVNQVSVNTQNIQQIANILQGNQAKKPQEGVNDGK